MLRLRDDRNSCPAICHVSFVSTRLAQKLILYFDCQTSGPVISYLSSSPAVFQYYFTGKTLCARADKIPELSATQLVLFLSIYVTRGIAPKLTSFVNNAFGEGEAWEDYIRAKGKVNIEHWLISKKEGKECANSNSIYISFALVYPDTSGTSFPSSSLRILFTELPLSFIYFSRSAADSHSSSKAFLFFLQSLTFIFFSFTLDFFFTWDILSSCTSPLALAISFPLSHFVSQLPPSRPILQESLSIFAWGQ